MGDAEAQRGATAGQPDVEGEGQPNRRTQEPYDLSSLTAYLRREGLANTDDVSLELISGGRSNLTYAMRVGEEQWILRRPPVGNILATAHDMSREHRVIAALDASKVPVPRTIALCEDTNVIGAPFYLMEAVEGQVLRTAEQVKALPWEDRSAVSQDLITTLAALHSLDPREVGLEEFGRPDGFMGRQVRRWTRQLEATTTPTDDMVRLYVRLAEDVPSPQRASVLHGDYRLDNCLVADTQITAVLDWEMSTLGDPLADLAMFFVYYEGLADIPNTVVDSPSRIPGMPTMDDLFERYARITVLSLKDMHWYVGFAWFKLAVILAGVHQRQKQQQVAGQEFTGVDQLIAPCVNRGLAELNQEASKW